MGAESKQGGLWEVESRGSEASMVRAVLRRAEEPTGEVSFLRSKWRKNERESEKGESVGVSGSRRLGGRVATAGVDDSPL